MIRNKRIRLRWEAGTVGRTHSSRVGKPTQGVVLETLLLCGRYREEGMGYSWVVFPESFNSLKSCSSPF